MLEFTVLASSLTSRWTLDRILPSLPSPGTQGFLRLCNDLKPHGFTTRGYLAESPTGRLSDVVLTISLLQEKVKLRISYEWFELTTDALYQDEIDQLVSIVGKVITVLKEVDPEMRLSRALVNIREHVSLATGKVDQFLADHLKWNRGLTEFNQLIPDAFAYNLTDGSTEVERITVARSLIYKDALFVDVYCDYPPPGDPQQLADRFARDYGRILGLVGLKSSSLK